MSCEISRTENRYEEGAFWGAPPALATPSAKILLFISRFSGLAVDKARAVDGLLIGVQTKINRSEASDLDKLQDDFEQIVRPIERSLLSITWNILANAHDAEDALQDAMAIVVRRWERVLAHPVPSALVIKICTECALDLLRKRVRRDAKPVVEAMRIENRISSPEEASQRTETKQTVMNAIASLPRNQAIAFTLRVVHEQNYDVIARTLGCSSSSVRTHVARARHRLSIVLQHLNPQGDEKHE
ncbi:MAG: sigma-70 family RNA polymerase sigma factor [Pirellulaceae bacterium]